MKFRASFEIPTRPDVEERGIYLVAEHRAAAKERIRDEVAALYKCALEDVEIWNLDNEFTNPDAVLDKVVGVGKDFVAYDDDPMILDP